MKGLTRDDIRTAADYEGAREAERRHLVDVMRHRRVHLGSVLSLVFENRETVRGAVEEAVRVERIADETAIASEVEAFNRLVPADGELSASLYLEVSDPALLPDRAAALSGIETAIRLSCGTETVTATANAVQTELGPPAVWQLRFPVSAPQREAWLAGGDVLIAVDHPACQAETVLTAEQREALAADLR